MGQIYFPDSGSGFLGRYFYNNFDTYKNLDVKINWGVFAAAVLFYFLYKITLASLWHYMTKLNQAAIGYVQAVTAYLYSILGKYIPGKVFMLLARVPAYEEKRCAYPESYHLFPSGKCMYPFGSSFPFLISLLFFQMSSWQIINGQPLSW